MPPKKGKKNPNEPVPIPEDTYLRARKLIDLKSAPKAPKGPLTNEEWCIQPAFHTMPEFKQVIHYWQQCAIVKFEERLGVKPPSRLKTVDSDEVIKKKWTRKEITEVFKYLKSQVKQANKRSGQFLKQLEKKEKKETKRQNLLNQIANTTELMNEELRSSRRFTEKQQLFDKRYMLGTKLGETCSTNNTLIVMEASEKQAAYVDEMKDEVSKLLNTVVAETGETFNLATFTGSAVNTWCAQYQNKEDPKKGMADSLKWLNKALNPKSMNSQPFPPDYASMINKFTAEGVPLPSRLFLCVSKRPEGSEDETLEIVRDIRSNRKPPSKNDPVFPINVVAFDPSAVGDTDEVRFFEELAGEKGSFMFDTSQDDLLALDKMLKAVAVKTKQLAKLNKKLDKMEDLSEQVAEDRKLLQVQLALQRMLESDFEVTNWALTNETPVEQPEI